MTNLTVAMVMVSFITMFLWLGQVAVTEINPDGSVFYSCESATFLSVFDKNQCSGTPVLDNSDETIEGSLPISEGNVEPSTGNIFTDTFSSAKDWFVQKTKLRYVYSILSAPSNVAKSMNLPNELAFMIGALWYSLNFFLIVAFFWGRVA